MIIGFGTPKSGTTSLARMLNVQHEFKTIDNKLLSETGYRDWLDDLANITKITGYTFGDVSFDHINNLDIWLDMDVTRICLIRDREDFVKSYLRFGQNRKVRDVFSQFDLTTEDGLREFWEWYYDLIFQNEDKFIIIGTESLPVWINKNEK